MKTIKKLLFMMLILFFCILRFKADDTDIFENGGYVSKTLTCEYKVNVEGNQSTAETNFKTIKIKFTSEIVDGSIYNEDYAGQLYEVWNANIISDDELGVKIGHDYEAANKMFSPNNIAIKPGNAGMCINKYSIDKIVDNQKNVDYTTCPNLSYSVNEKEIYSEQYASLAQADSKKFTKLIDKSKESSETVSGDYAECAVDVPYSDGQTIINFRFRITKPDRGRYSTQIALDYTKEDDFHTVNPNDDKVWQGYSSELGRNIVITKEDWQSIASQISYQKCKDNASVQLTLTEVEDKDIQGKNIIRLAKDAIPESEGGKEVYGSNNGTINTGADGWGWELGGEISEETSTCSELLGSNIVNFIQSAWTIVKVISIVLTILFGILDFIQATSKDKDVLMESISKNVKRLIIVVLILLLPSLIEIIGKLFGISDILCGIK